MNGALERPATTPATKIKRRVYNKGYTPLTHVIAVEDRVKIPLRQAVMLALREAQAETTAPHLLASNAARRLGVPVSTLNTWLRALGIKYRVQIVFES